MGTIQSGVYILQNNLNDLIDYQMLENGQLKINMRQFKLKDCYDQILKIIKPQLKNPDVRFMSYCDSNVYPFMTNDQERLMRIILNILLNAQKFTQQGFIKFTIKSVQPKKESKPNIVGAGGWNQRRQFIKFEVQDSGLGIPEEKIPFIFNLFESDLQHLGTLNQANS